MNLKYNAAAIIVIALLLSGCANTENVQSCFKDQPSGFIEGVFHGFFLFPAFIVSLFNNGIAIYDLNNTGHLYDLGFLIGLGFFSDRASSSARKVSKKSPDGGKTSQEKETPKKEAHTDSDEDPTIIPGN